MGYGGVVLWSTTRGGSDSGTNGVHSGNRFGISIKCLGGKLVGGVWWI